MNIIRNIKAALAVGVMSVFASCSSWLDVKPDDRIMDDELFKDKDGYMLALTGIYSELNRPSLYGANLSMGMIDVLGQYYNCNVSNHAYSLYMDYSYGQEECKNRLEAIWTELYELIANSNAILERCDEGEGNHPVLPETYYRMIKGEALALRAMMHFDLLRMFGPVWSEEGKAIECIPYMTLADKTVQPLLRADKVLELVIKDLKEAADLLEPMDPVITHGAENVNTDLGSNDMNFRQYRLNYFAVKALLARACLWGGDKVNAGKYAKEVLDAVTTGDKPLFPLIDSKYVDSYSDYVFSKEVLFGLHNTSRTDQVYNTFFVSSLKADELLTFAGDYATGRLHNVYDDENDLRREVWNTAVQDGREFVCCQKFRPIGTYQFSYMIPLVRVSEMYLIAAECEADSNTKAQDALDAYVNKVRLSRHSVNLAAATVTELERHIQWEYFREFIGEGQMFFYYKRKAMQNIPDGGLAEGTRNMALKNYVFPLPDSETSQRPEKTTGVTK